MDKNKTSFSREEVLEIIEDLRGDNKKLIRKMITITNEKRALIEDIKQYKEDIAWKIKSCKCCLSFKDCPLW